MEVTIFRVKYQRFICLFFQTVFLLLVGSEVGANPMKYFRHFTSDNVYRLDLIPSFQVAIPEGDEKGSSYYVARYEDNLLVSAERFENSQLIANYEFDETGRPKLFVSGDIRCEISYGHQSKVERCQGLESFSSYSVNWLYKENLLVRKEKKNSSDEILELSEFDHQLYREKKLDKDGNLLEEVNMVRPGK